MKGRGDRDMRELIEAKTLEYAYKTMSPENRSKKG
jgi:hypothetical protein